MEDAILRIACGFSGIGGGMLLLKDSVETDETVAAMERARDAVVGCKVCLGAPKVEMG